MSDNSQPEFNNGFITALALFYGHRMDFSVLQRQGKDKTHDLRLYTGSDHLFALEIPDKISDGLKQRIESWRDSVFHLRLERVSEDEATNLFERCKDILMQLDDELFGLKVVVNYS